MVKFLWVLLLASVATIAGCGPDTIFVRPGLDTPQQHISNGYQLLERGKVEDAYREFNRAMELDPDDIGAHIGLGIALGHKGQYDAGRQTIEAAERLATGDADREKVRKGFERLEALRSME